MRPFTIAGLLALPIALAQPALSSPKRGLIYVDTEKSSDDHFWEDGPLTWYYNYKATPSHGIDHSSLQFVPMLWGSRDTKFYKTVKGLIDDGMNISHVLAFNEPDGCKNGGSCVDAQTAAHLWTSQIEPLKDLGVTLGAPAVTSSPDGFVWLQNFFSECAGKCSAAFIPAHFYGNFEGLASHIGQINATYPNMTTWVTEFGDPNQSLGESQTFYNESSAFLDRLTYVERYAYFGSFRSDVSNIGPNASMLTQNGKLTDIGAWYLGQRATGNIPKGDATQIVTLASWAIVLVAVSICWLA